jgi:hypothetical protein
MSGPAWRRYLRFWGADPAADVDEELRFHIECRVQEYIAQGMAPDAARAEALRRFGDVAAARRAARRSITCWNRNGDVPTCGKR